MTTRRIEVVSLRDLRVGDKVVAYVLRGWRHNLENGPLAVKEVSPALVMFTLGAGGWMAVEPSGIDEFIILERPAAQFSAADYPHHCTRCGRPAYVGLNETDHADEGAARDCPAPRGRRAS